MYRRVFPVIDPVATGKNIVRLRQVRGMTVKDLQQWFGFEEPRAIYKWQQGQTLPSVDNLIALSALLEVPVEDILVCRHSQSNSPISLGRQDHSCRPLFFVSGCLENGGTQQELPPFRIPFVRSHSELCSPHKKKLFFGKEFPKVFKTFACVSSHDGDVSTDEWMVGRANKRIHAGRLNASCFVAWLLHCAAIGQAATPIKTDYKSVAYSATAPQSKYAAS